MLYVKIPALALLLFGLIMIARGRPLAWRYVHLEAQVVPGKIVDVVREDHSRISDYFFTVTYTTAKGEARRGEHIEVNPKFVDAHLTGSQITQPQVEVRYEESNPGNVFIVGAASNGYGELIVGLILLIMSWGCFWLVGYLRRLDQREMQAMSELYFRRPSQMPPPVVRPRANPPGTKQDP